MRVARAPLQILDGFLARLIHLQFTISKKPRHEPIGGVHERVPVLRVSRTKFTERSFDVFRVERVQRQSTRRDLFR